MTILTKIEKNKDIYRKIQFDLLEAGDISSFKIEGENYELLTPFQAAALQRLGIGLSFYESNKMLHSQHPIVPKETKVKKIDIEPNVVNHEKLEQFVTELEGKI